MQQRYTMVKAGQIAAPGDTDPHNFTQEYGGVVYFSTPAGNNGTVTIRGAGETSGGLVLAAGVGEEMPLVVLGPILKLSLLSYEFSDGTDTLNVLVLG